MPSFPGAEGGLMIPTIAFGIAVVCCQLVAEFEKLIPPDDDLDAPRIDRGEWR